MSARQRLSREEKRQAKLARWGKSKVEYEVTPLSGPHYQSDAWIAHVHATESAIHEVIQLSGKRLTNDQVKTTLTQLVRQLRDGESATLAVDEPELSFSTERIVEYLIWNIRRYWSDLVDRLGPVRVDDFVGILRTLLNSIEAREWHTGPDQGYVAFLDEFLGDGQALRLGNSLRPKADTQASAAGGVFDLFQRR